MWTQELNHSLHTMTRGPFLAGAATGAVATLLITNPAVQRSLMQAAARVVQTVRAGTAEMRERFHDAEAEVQAAAHPVTPADGTPAGDSPADPAPTA